VLGGELARARAAEERVRATTSDPSPLAGIRYTTDATLPWRWVDAPQDRQVAGFLTRYASADPAGRARLRTALRLDDLYTLVTSAGGAPSRRSAPATTGRSPTAWPRCHRSTWTASTSATCGSRRR